MEPYIKKHNPFISVITINFNNRIGLERTIQSVISQTYQDFEYIIIDGGSNDGSKDIIEKYEKYFSYWVSEPDNGIYHAMNKGVKQAKGEYCIFMNSGDFLCNPQTLKLATDKIKEVDTDFCTGQLICCKNNKICGVVFPHINPNFLIANKSIEHQATFARRKWLNQYPFNENTKITGDWQNFITCISINGASYSPINTAIAFYDTAGFSCTNSDILAKERQIFKNSLIPTWFQRELDTILTNDVHLFVVDKKKHPIMFLIIKYIKKFKTQPTKYWYKIKFNIIKEILLPLQKRKTLK